MVGKTRLYPIVFWFSLITRVRHFQKKKKKKRERERKRGGKEMEKGEIRQKRNSKKKRKTFLFPTEMPEHLSNYPGRIRQSTAECR